MAVSSAGLRPKSDCSGKDQKQLYSKLQTRPLVREDDDGRWTKFKTPVILKFHIFQNYITIPVSK
jgi:hypothetical protein